VVGNLLQNAFKFTRPQTAVTLRVGASTDRVQIEIEDECGGLPGGNGHALFRSFEQRSADRTGLGLGLAFSRWALKPTMAGSIRATCLIRDASLLSTCRGSPCPRSRSLPRLGSKHAFVGDSRFRCGGAPVVNFFLLAGDFPRRRFLIIES
jgi:Histidine kinase-, DNA gyrase B-, and HSP90-like ATPase